MNGDAAERQARTSEYERNKYLEYGQKHLSEDPQTMEMMWANWNKRLTEDHDHLLFALACLTVMDDDDGDNVTIGPRGWEIVQNAIKQARS